MKADQLQWSVEARARLKEAAAKWGTRAKLADEVGIHKNTLAQILNGDGDPGIGKIADIARVLNISLDQILGGASEEKPDTADEDLVSLPMAGAKLSAGPGVSALGRYKQSEWSFSRRWLMQSFGRVTGLELMQVQGDSQVPDLHENDWVMIDTTRTELKDGLYALLLDGEDMLIKRVQVEGRYIRLLSRAEGYEPIVIDKLDEGRKLDLLGRVVWSGNVHSGA